jgi:protein SCO1/2
MTRRNWLVAAGATTAVAGTTNLLGQDKPLNEPYNFQDLSPRELIQKRHLPNVELITQDNRKVRFYNDLVKDRRVVIQFMFARCQDICPVVTHKDY